MPRLLVGSLSSLLFALASCTPAHHPGTDATHPKAPECPESHAVCITAPDCQYDEARACNVCRCTSPNGGDPGVGGVPPIQ
ncbi:MAG TPA: hypothetical protein VGI39_34670 [Polyangiaceae bacterium]|jgi:hypothetical protein